MQIRERASNIDSVSGKSYVHCFYRDEMIEHIFMCVRHPIDLYNMYILITHLHLLGVDF